MYLKEMLLAGSILALAACASGTDAPADPAVEVLQAAGYRLE